MNRLKINMKSIILATAVSSTLILSSCSDWLNVKPSNQTSAEEQFSKEEGFKTALSGIYTLMVNPDLYGREMTFGVVDYLGQYWNIPASNTDHYNVALYEFEEKKAVTIVDKIWTKAYNVIANANDLLAFVDVNKSVFNSDMAYSVIKGEALAIRAYVHFDMLRLFAPYNFKNADQTEKWLPYVDVFSRDTKLSLTNKEFADRVMTDLKAAAELLKLDPIYTKTVSSDEYFKNRHFHINYYAVKALMARVALYAGDTANAQLYAQEVIDAQNSKDLFRWITTDEVTYVPIEHRDRTFSSEHIFALNVVRMGDNIKNFFINASSTQLKLYTSPSVIFENNDEFRSKFVDTDMVPTKFSQPEKQNGVSLEQKLQRMPLIRITEMYYIMAECTNDIRYINSVRSHRGIEEDLPPVTDLRKAITSEVRKEFIGEGQRYYYHKRVGDVKIDRNVAVRYTLIMPENEINFGGRPRPAVQ